MPVHDISRAILLLRGQRMLPPAQCVYFSMPAERYTLVAYPIKQRTSHMQIGLYTFGQSSTFLGDAMSKAKRQITQLLDTFIDREELKQRVNTQGA